MANLLETISGFFNYQGSGKDQFTQTRYNYALNVRNNQKGENYVDVSNGNLQHLVDTTPQLKTVIHTKGNLLANGRWCEIKNGKEVENSEIVRTLENPNPLMNGNEWLRSFSINYDIYGNTFIHCLKAFAGANPSVFWVLPSVDMSVLESGKIWQQVKKEKIVTGYKLCTTEGLIENFDIKDIIHFKEASAHNPILGDSKMRSLMMPISNIRGAYGFRNRIINNNAALGILSSDSSDGLGVALDDTEQKRLNAGLSQAFGMQDGKANIMMSESSVKWSPMSYPTKDLMLFEEIDADFRAIIDAFGLNDNIFSRTKGSTYENIAEGIKLAYQNCIIPFAEDIALGMTQANGLNGVDHYLKLDYSHIEFLKDDQVKKSEVEKRKSETYSILMAEGRADLAAMLYE